MANIPRYIHSENVHNLNAPNQVVPIVMDLFHPSSVLDVGCGIGTWLHALTTRCEGCFRIRR